MTVQEFAQRVGYSTNSILRILRADEAKPTRQRRIRGAVKQGDKYRGMWIIPESAVAHFQRDPRGRKASV